MHRPIHYILDAVSPIYVVSNHNYDSHSLQMAERLLRAQPVSVANHVKARRAIGTGRNLINLCFTYFCIPHVRQVNV